MTVTVVLNVATLSGVSYAPNTVLGAYAVGLRPANGDTSTTQTQTVADLSQPIRFPKIAGGEYSVGVTRLDAAGNPVGDVSTLPHVNVPDSIAPPPPQNVIGDGPGTITVGFEADAQ